jgi:hypothetical protein
MTCSRRRAVEQKNGVSRTFVEGTQRIEAAAAPVNGTACGPVLQK